VAMGVASTPGGKDSGAGLESGTIGSVMGSVLNWD
jgi:hypothetical protein